MKYSIEHIATWLKKARLEKGLSQRALGARVGVPQSLEVIWAEVGAEGLAEFIRRFVFNALIGNGDMHLKNWSLIYPNRGLPKLAPAYDYVSTLPYLPGDALALNFVGSKAFHSLTIKQFKRFVAKSLLPEKLVFDTIEETVSLFAQVWEARDSLPMDVEYLRLFPAIFKLSPFGPFAKNPLKNIPKRFIGIRFSD
jgi:hypothetical protein